MWVSYKRFFLNTLFIYQSFSHILHFRIDSSSEHAQRKGGGEGGGSVQAIAVSEHFLSNNHSDAHTLLIPIEKLKNERDSFRKAREAHIIHKAKTIEPLGVNKRDEL